VRPVGAKPVLDEILDEMTRTSPRLATVSGVAGEPEAMLLAPTDAPSAKRRARTGR
jgi:hypothetical protein